MSVLRQGLIGMDVSLDIRDTLDGSHLAGAANKNTVRLASLFE